jgi:diguanylate cyclase (GGDEF)-like protein
LSRRAFVTALEARAARALSERAIFGLCIVDVDHFKNINLSHGPSCGDGALRDIAQRLVRTTSDDAAETRVVGRYDGDAFAVLVDADTPETLARAAESMRRAVAAQTSQERGAMSASVGAVLARLGESADALLVRAEQTLYLAKQFGRDRVEIGRSPAPLRAEAPVTAMRRIA